MATYNGTNGIDIFVGLPEDNTFVFEPGELQNNDTVHGGNHDDTLDFFGQGPYTLNPSNFANVRSIEFINFHETDFGDTHLTLSNAMVASSDYAGIADKFAVSVQMGSGEDTVNLSKVHAGYRLSVNGGNGADNFIGGAADAEYTGAAGNDHLTAGLGHEIFNGLGNEPTHGETDIDSVTGTAINVDGDTYYSSDGLISDPTGDEHIEVTTAGVFAFTESGFDSIDLANGDNHATITLTVFFADITVDGGNGNDVVTIVEPEHDDQFGPGSYGMKMFGHDGDDQLYATSKDDTLNGGDGVDILDGKDGNDILNGGLLGDIMYGGDGDDRFVNVTAGDAVVEQANHGHDTMETALVTVSIVAHVEDLIFTGITAVTVTGNVENNAIWGGNAGDTLKGAEGSDELFGGGGVDHLFGQKNDDTLHGEDGNDILDGGAGDDVLFGGADSNTLKGGSGVDTADFSAVLAGLDIDMQRADEVLVNGNINQLTSIEKIIGGNSADTFVSDHFDAVEFLGGGGFDTVDFSAETADITSSAYFSGNERIISGSGDDFLSYYLVMEGNAGDDLFSNDPNGEPQVFDGGADVDTVSFYFEPTVGPPDDLIVDLEDNSLNRGLALGDTLTSIENVTGNNETGDSLYGSEVDNILQGLSGDDNLIGRGGNDTLFGGDGVDQMTGDEGDDTLIGGPGPGDLMYGGDGVDTVDYSASGFGVTITMQTINGIDVGGGTGGDAGGDYLETIEVLIGSAHDDTLTGADADNVLEGGAGGDILSGGKGTDTYYGGTGADFFAWQRASDSKAGNHHDVVADFSQADGDKLDLSAIDAKTGHSGNDDFHFTGNHGADAFSGDKGELRWFQSGGDTMLQGDTDGDGAADIEVALTGLFTLHATDFVP